MKLKRILALAVTLTFVALNLAAHSDTAESEYNSTDENEPLLTVDEILEHAYLVIPQHITIRGEQFSTGLTELELNEMDLTDEEFVPLRYMTHLTSLILHNNQIDDITPLVGLPNLTWSGLHLTGNPIEDFSPLQHLPRT